MEISLLSKGLESQSDLRIDNETASGAVATDSTETLIPLNVTCGAFVEMVEVQNPQTSEWKKVTELGTGNSFDCTDDGKASFSVPVSFVAAYSVPTTSGDRSQDFQIRWMSKNPLEAESSVFYRTVKALFVAPVVSSVLANVSLANSGANGYSISGTCVTSASDVLIEGDFVSSATASCVNGTFAAAMSFSGVPTSTSATVRIKQMGQSPGWTYGELQQTVMVDLVAPTLNITSPMENKIFTSADFSGNSSINVQGACSESMSVVQFYLNGTQAGETTCSAALGFDFNISVPEGPFAIKVRQTDVVGNVGESAALNLNKDTTGPESFTIMGVKSQDSNDVTTDEFLRGSGLRVDYSSAAGASTYEIFIKDVTGSTTICPLLSVTTSYANFAGDCVLSSNTTYKVYAQTKDANGNVTIASNNGYSFQVQYAVPQIVKIYPAGGAGNLTYTSGSLYIYVEFDRDVQASGTPSLTLNTGATAAYIGAYNPKTLKFDYSIAANEYAPQLEAVTLNVPGGAKIADATNSAVNANLSFTDDGSAAYLRFYNIRIDTKSPSAVTGLVLGAVPYKINETTPFSFNLVAEDPGDPVTYQAQVVRSSDNVVMTSWAPVANNNAMLGLGLEARPATVYRIEVRAIDSVGNISAIQSATYTSFACPLNFTYVYDSGLGVQPLCVAAFEAKVSSGAPQFQPEGIPVSATQLTATSACAFMGSGYDLITNTEWNKVAEIIRAQAGNWTSGAVGTGILHRGYSQSGVLAAATIGDPCAPSSESVCASSGLRRLSYLPFGQEIWDFAGNAWELTKDTDNISYTPNSGFVSMFTASDGVAIKYGTSHTCSDPSVSGGYCGYGKLDFSMTPGSNTVVWRGGAVNAGTDVSGVFAALRSGSPGGSGVSNSSFRCVYRPSTL